MRPIHELVQSAELRNPFGARPQHEVIGIGEHDVGSERAHFVGAHRLDGGLGPDRHEGGRAHHAVRGLDLAEPRAPVGFLQLKREAGHRKISYRVWGSAATYYPPRNSKQASP